MASPCPSVADVKVIQLTGEVARHVHSRATAIDTVPVPPADPNAPDELVIVASHRVAVGDVTFVLVEAEPPQPNETAPSVRNSRDVRACTAVR